MRIPSFVSPSVPLVLLLCLTLPAASAQQPKTAAASRASSMHLTDYPADGVLLGTGWDSLVNQKTSAVCVTYNETADTGQEKWEDVQSITDQYSLMNELQMSAEAEVKALGTSVKGKTSFVEKTKINNEFSNFVVRATVQNGVKYIVPEKTSGVIGFTPRALALAKSDPIKFEQMCGDTFVSSIYAGGEIDAVLIFSTRSQEDHRALEASLSFSGWNVEATASAQSVADTFRRNNQLKISAWQSGGSGDDFSLSQEDLNKMIQQMPASVAANPTPYQVGIKRYDSLPDWPGNTGSWNNPTYRDIASQYFKLNSLRYQAVDILSHPEDYIFSNGTTIAQLENMKDDLQRLTASAKKDALACIASDGAKCQLTGPHVSDYTYRLQMPVTKGSFPEYIALDKATADVAIAELGIANAQAQIDAIPICKAGIKTLFSPCPGLNTQFVIAVTAKTQAIIRKSQALAAFLPGLKAAIARTWLTSVNNVRCNKDVLDSGCLLGSELKVYIDKINVSPNPVSAAAVLRPPSNLRAQ